MHAFYEANVKHDSMNSTMFLSLDKPLPKRIWILPFTLTKDKNGKVTMTEIPWKNVCTLNKPEIVIRRRPKKDSKESCLIYKGSEPSKEIEDNKLLKDKGDEEKKTVSVSDVEDTKKEDKKSKSKGSKKVSDMHNKTIFKNENNELCYL